MKAKKKSKAKKAWNHERFIFAALRKIWRWSPARRYVLQNAERPDGSYTCSQCGKGFPKEEVAVDHKEPVVNPQTGFKGWDIYVERLFCGPEGLQILCLVDHKVKTKAENAERRKYKEAA